MKRTHIVSAALLGTMLGLVLWQIAGCISGAEAGSFQQYPPATEEVISNVSTSSTWATVLGNGNTSGGSADVIVATNDQISAAAGSNTHATYSFTGELATVGMYDCGTNQICFTANGAREAEIGTSGIIGTDLTTEGDITVQEGGTYIGAATGASGTDVLHDFTGTVNGSGTHGSTAMRLAWTRTAEGSGTEQGLYINAPTGFTGTLLEIALNSVGLISLSEAGLLTYAEGVNFSGSSSGSSGSDNMYDFAGVDTGTGTHGYNVINIDWTGDTGSGTSNGLNMNAPSGFTGGLISLDVNSANKLYCDEDGAFDTLTHVGSAMLKTTESFVEITQSDDDGVMFAVDDTVNVANRNFIFTSNASAAMDHGHTGLSGDTTINLHSSELPDNSDAEYSSWTHDGDDAVYSVGLGGYSWGIDAQPARGTYTVTGNVTLNETFRVNATNFTAKDAETVGSDEFLRTGTVTEIAASMVAVINGGSEIGNVWSYNDAGVVTVEWLTKGVAGNSIVFTEACTNVAIAPGGGFLEDGVAAATLLTLDEDGVMSLDGGTDSSLYINAPTGWTGDLLKMDVNSNEKFAVNQAGAADFAGSVAVTGSFQSSSDNGLYHDTATGYYFTALTTQSVEAMAILTGSTNNYVVFGEFDDRAGDWDHAQQSTPTLFFQSDISGSVSNQEFGSITHDGADFVIDTGGPAAGVGSAPTTIRNSIRFKQNVVGDGTATFVVPRGEMTMYEATETVTINTQSIYHAVKGYSTGDVQDFTFDAGRVVDANLLNELNPSASVLRIETSAAHGLTTGDVVTQTGMNNAGHNGVTEVTVVDTTNYDCDDISYVGNAGASAGVVDEPSYLQAGTGAAGEYSVHMHLAAAHAGGAANVFKFEVNIGSTEPDNIVGEHSFPNNEAATIASSGFLTIADGDRLWVAIQNKTGANDIVIEHANLNLHRL